jgi:hypothetical protein
VSDLLPYIEAFASYARSDVHAERWFNHAKGRWEYRPVHARLDAARLRKHLNGGPHVGVYLMNERTDVTRLGALDLDDHDGTLPSEKMREVAGRLAAAATKYGLSPWLVRSGGGHGVHLLFRWDAPQLASSVRGVLLTLLKGERLSDGDGGVANDQVEIFPKQNHVDAGRFGNLLAVPFSRESVPLSPELQPIETPTLWSSSAPLDRAREEPVENSSGDGALAREALRHLPADDYGHWVKIALALKHDLGDAGYEIWDEWSKTSAKYADAQTTRGKWDGLDPRREDGVTLRTIFHLAGEAGWQGASSRRPSIAYDPTDPKRMAREAEAALLASGKAIYQQNGKLVRVVRLDRPSEGRAVTRDAGAVVLHPANATWLTGEFMAAAKWTRRTKKGASPIPLPRSVADTYGEMVDEWRVPPLLGTVETPTLYRRGDGFGLLQTPGYDPASGLYYDPGNVVFPPIPVRPTKREAVAALERFLLLLASFPFVPDDVTDEWEPARDEGVRPSRARSVAISAWLTGLIRRSMESAPLHAIDAVSPGTGKGYLVRVLSTILTGRRAAAMPWIRSEEEQRKRILSVLMEGDPIVLLDNATTSIGGAPLNIMLSEPIFKDRVLGKSASASALTNCLVFATGNNLEFEADTTRRVVRCRMDARHERPQDREFASDPLADAKHDRAALVGGGLTILLAYLAAGRPARGQVKHVGSYEDWTLVREAIVWLDQPDPADTMKEITADDPVANEVRAVMDAWFDAYGTTATRLADAVEDARRGSPFANGDRYRHALFEAMHVAAKGRDPTEAALGRWFKKHEGQIIDGRRFVRSGDAHKGREIALRDPKRQGERGALNPAVPTDVAEAWEREPM